MPRHPRLFIPGATYHVYCRVARGEFVFDDDFEAQEFVETLREVRNLDTWTIYAWCLMGDRYHPSEFVVLFESASGHPLCDLSSRNRTDRQVDGRVEFAVLAATRFGFRGCDIAALLRKSGNSVTRWINRGLSCERDDEEFRAQLNFLDASIPSRD